MWRWLAVSERDMTAWLMWEKDVLMLRATLPDWKGCLVDIEPPVVPSVQVEAACLSRGVSLHCDLPMLFSLSCLTFVNFSFLTSHLKFCLVLEMLGRVENCKLLAINVFREQLSVIFLRGSVVLIFMVTLSTDFFVEVSFGEVTSRVDIRPHFCRARSCWFCLLRHMAGQDFKTRAEE